jgi:hypothetical protein
MFLVKECPKRRIYSYTEMQSRATRGDPRLQNEFDNETLNVVSSTKSKTQKITVHFSRPQFVFSHHHTLT